MFQLLFAKLTDAHFLAMLLAAVAAGATVITLALPLLSSDTLAKRMNAVGIEREKIRQREREKMMRGMRKCGWYGEWSEEKTETNTNSSNPAV